MPDTLEDDLRRALAAGADAVTDDFDLPAAWHRLRRRKRVTSRVAVAMAGIVAFGGGLVAWRAWEETGRTVTGPASDGASGILVTPPDGNAPCTCRPARAPTLPS